MKLLFVTWDGPGPNYMESLFLPIFERVQQRSCIQFDVLQYSWDSAERTKSVAKLAAELNIRYQSKNIWRRPATVPATLAMMVKGASDIVKYVRDNQIDVLMPRSIIPAAMCLHAMRRIPKVRLLYDADGLMADERVDFGSWKKSGVVYKCFKWIERSAVKRADAVITRSEKAKSILTGEAGNAEFAEKVFVVTNGIDTNKFCAASAENRKSTRESLGVPLASPLVVYCGSIGQQYYPDKMIVFFTEVYRLRSACHFMVLANEPEKMKQMALRKVPNHVFHCFRVSPRDVPRYLAASDLGLAFRRPAYSQQAVAPIKVGEYLLCGLPVVCSSNIGDLDSILTRDIGIIVDADTDADLHSAARWFLDDMLPQRAVFRNRCHSFGIDHFSLEIATDDYLRAMTFLNGR